MNRGYIKLWRKVMENPVLKDRGKRYSRFEAWIYLCMMARGVEDPKTGIKRGELEASERYLAKAWLWSKSVVHSFILDLIENKMVTKKDQTKDKGKNQKKDRLTICNYDTYNPSKTTNRTSASVYPVDNKGITKKDHKKDRANIGEQSPWDKHETTKKTTAIIAQQLNLTESDVRTGTKIAKLNEVIKEVKEQTSQATSDVAEKLAEKLRAAIEARDPKARSGHNGSYVKWIPDIDKLMRIDGRLEADIEAVITWCQSNGCFWGPNILSGKKLREKFDTMWGQMQRDSGQKVETVPYDYDESRPK